jgi:hypothetical protein
MDPLAMIVNRYRQLLLGAILPNYVLVKIFLYFQWLGKFMGRRRRSVGFVVLKDRVANGNALIANVGTRVIAGG